jgi:predicted peptidase
MKRLIPFLSLVLMLGLAGCATTDGPKGAETGDKAKADAKGTISAHRFRMTRPAVTRLDYLLHLPEGYDSGGSKRWPTILFLHGAGERGDNVEKVLVHGPPKLAKQDPTFPFIVIAPQTPTGGRWHADELIALLDNVTDDHAVDPKRVYLTGLSMGGYGSWELGAAHPGRFAAIAPICGGGNTIDVRLARRVEGHPLKSLPVWAFHGAKDSVVPLTESERMVEAFKAIGNENVKLTVYPEANHDSWTATYDDPGLYEWFLSHAAAGGD